MIYVLMFLRFFNGQSTVEPLCNLNELVVCGNDKIVIIDVAKSTSDQPKIIWEWQPQHSKKLPEIYKTKYFKKNDECKPINCGKEIMITSSRGGVAIINRKTKEVSFYTYLPQAHSIECLPNNRIILAASIHKEGNYLAVYDRGKLNAPVLFQDSLYSGHGVVWDGNRQLLYALGFLELRAYRLENWNTKYPSLELVNNWYIKGESGHDLIQSPFNKEELILSEKGGVWVFNKNEETFLPFEQLQHTSHVKGISFSSQNKLAYIKAEESWWSHRIYFDNSNQFINLPNINLYKARWMNCP
jgi:hypothetical protein